MRKAGIKQAFALFVCVILILPLASALGADSYPFVGYTTDSLRLRQKPSSSAVILLVIPKGEAVAVSGADGSYYIAQYGGKQGYALKSFITGTAPAAGGALASPPPASAALEALYPMLSAGSTGAGVKALQMALEELGFYAGAFDGKYGPGTQQALVDFQKMNALPQSGMADPLSQQKLFEGRPKNTAGQAVDVRTLPAIAGLTLRPGDRGDAIGGLQNLLRSLGYYKGAIDGVFGDTTESAVRDFQRFAGLTADGKAGPNTLKALQDAANPSEPSPAADAGVTPAPVFTQAQDTKADYPYTTTASAAVNLRKSASLSGTRILTVPLGASISVLSVSGDFLKVSYKSYTGYVLSDYVNVPEQYLSGGTLPIDTKARQDYEPLATGAGGDKVRALQQALTELGFYSGEIDSRFGAQTLAALKAFQEKNKLRPTGLALPELQQLIYEKRPRNARGLLVNLKLLPPVPGYPMALGDMGDAVLQLNQSLQLLGHLTDSASDTFTGKTLSAVKLFQKAHSITVSGKVDSFTLLAINTAVSAGQKTQAPGPAATPSPTPLTPDNVIVLQLGTRGVAVKALQQRLVALRYYAITPDSVYGSKDVTAVKAFQIKNGLKVTGIADLDTQIAINSPGALPADIGTGGLPQVTSNPLQASLRIGSVGEAVIALQSRLITLKYLSGKADGYFGTQTAAAVTAFQRKSNLKADGIAGAQTLSAVYSAKAAANTTATGSTASQEEDSEAKPAVLRLGDSGSQVKAMQQKLIDLKYLTGGADGIFGPKSFLALQAFQKNNRLQADGIAGSLTLSKLADPRAIASSGLSAVLPTATPKPAEGQTPPSGSFTAPRAAEVRFADWEEVLRSRTKSMPGVIIYDFMSGAHYRVNVFSVGKHADGEPPTKADTEIMEKALGYNNWEPRPVWVIYSDGRVYMASTHSHGHEVDHNALNGLTGHICIHFPRDMADAAATGPYAVAHQNKILAGWDLTQSMAR